MRLYVGEMWVIVWVVRGRAAAAGADWMVGSGDAAAPRERTSTRGENEGEGNMARYTPGSQSRAVMAQKEVIAARLLEKGLTTSQVAVQLRCSPNFVRRIRSSLDGQQAIDRRAGSLSRSA